MSTKVLIVEDVVSIAMVYSSWLKKHKIASKHVETGRDAITELASGEYSAVLLDLQLPDISGLEVLDQIGNDGTEVSVIVVTSSGSVNTAVDAMRRGAYDFLIKPAAENRLVTTVKNASERGSLKKQIQKIKKDFPDLGKFGFIGNSISMVAVYKTIEAVTNSKASVFVTGESGTGKEVCAQAIHGAGNRSDAPFGALNCAAIPKDLIESEIFGHTKGAFSGATNERDGAALSANGGTLFLDEICEMDLNLQSKLLRFLQTGSVQKVGSDKEIPVDVRIICATNRDPVKEVREGRFREDLYYRLHVVPIELPPLRDREDDVVLIANTLLQQFTEEEGKDFTGFDPGAKDKLTSHDWPGNVRELQNVIRNAVILNSGDTINAEMLNIGTGTLSTIRAVSSSGTVSNNVEKASAISMNLDLTRTFDEIEREILETVIAQCGNSVPKAAQLLQLSPSTIYRKREVWQTEDSTE